MKYLQGDLSLCESGESSTDGFCVSKINLGTSPFPCDDINPCSYNSTLSSAIFVDPNACACSKGKSFKQFCPLGSGMKLYQAYITAFKAYLQRFASSKCHTVERSSCMLLNKDTNFFSQFYSSQINAKNYHILNDAQDCVKKVIYPGLFGPSSNGTSPSVKCGNLDSPTCASFSFDAAIQKGFFIGKSCSSSSQRCDVDISIFDTNSAVNKTCLDKASPPNTR